jgi:hypothetical protein
VQPKFRGSLPVAEPTKALRIQISDCFVSESVSNERFNSRGRAALAAGLARGPEKDQMAVAIK